MPTTKWHGVAADLRARTMAGEWQPGHRIPSQRDLAKHYDVGSTVVNRAINTLVSEGLLEADPNRPATGTRVAERPVIGSSRDRLANMMKTGRASSASETARIVSSELISASPHLARALGVEPGSQIVARHRIHIETATGTPVEASTSHLPGAFTELVPELLSLDKVPGGTAGALARHGKVVAHIREEYMTPARGATMDEAAELEIAVGMPVQARRNWWRDADGDVIEYGESVVIAGRWQSVECCVT